MVVKLVVTIVDSAPFRFVSDDLYSDPGVSWRRNSARPRALDLEVTTFTVIVRCRDAKNTSFGRISVRE